MTADERDSLHACARMLRDIFGGCGCLIPRSSVGAVGCDRCDPYHLLKRAPFSTLDDLLGGASRTRQTA